MTKLYLSLALAASLLSNPVSAQNSVLFEQVAETSGYMVPTMSTTNAKMYSADDFTVTSNSVITKITLEGMQMMGNLSSILTSVDVVILEAQDLTGTPFNGNIVFQSMNTMTGVTVTGTGMDKNFEIDLSGGNIQVESGKKYWIVFTANSNLPSSSTVTDWYWYPSAHNSATSLSKSYYNGNWTTNAAGLTFKIEGTNALGTIEFSSTAKELLQSTVVQNQLTVIMKNYKFADIYDLSGRKVISSFNEKINVESLSPNTYIAVLVSNDGQQKSVKFIKR